MKPVLLKGNRYIDHRGEIKFNNDFNASEVKRIYIIENDSVHIKRGWQGHKIEQRWFAAIAGSFEIKLISVDNWVAPNVNAKPLVFSLNSDTLDYLHIPSGYISYIQSKEENSKLLVLADHLLGEIEDEFRYPLEYFNCTK